MYINHIASSYLPALSGPPVYKITQYLALESDQQIHELYSSLCELLDGDNNEFTRSRLSSDFIVNDIQPYQDMRGLNSRDMSET